jgi:hypothetical protein
LVLTQRRIYSRWLNGKCWRGLETIGEAIFSSEGIKETEGLAPLEKGYEETHRNKNIYKMKNRIYPPNWNDEMS